MRAGELLGLPVVGPDGSRLGVVLDVRLVQDGPVLGAYAALRVQGLVVGRYRLASRLGYDRHERPGPWVVRRLLRPLVRHNGFLPWELAALEGDAVRSAVQQLPPLPPL